MINWVTMVTLLCIALCFLITGVQVNRHLTNYTKPMFQSKIIMILLMPPIYAALSSLAIWLEHLHAYFLLIRDIYESVVIYSFFQLLRAYVSSYEGFILEDKKIHVALATKGEAHHSFPISLVTKPIELKTEEDGRRVYKQCKLGILQYVPIKFCCVFLIIMDFLAWSASETVYYICIFVVSISVTIALYWLIFFFHVLQRELAPFKPLLKFLVIKGILFLTFWQEIILWMFSLPLQQARFLPPSHREAASEVLSALLVNVEMVLMSILTAVAFNYQDFVKEQNSMEGFLMDVLKGNLEETWINMKEIVHNR
jgi:hypothetical protein